MSPINHISTQNRLARLSEIVQMLTEINQTPKTNFLKDKILQGAAMYNMVIGIEIIVDVGSHLLAELGKASSQSYRDIIIGLGELKIIPEIFADTNQEMANFRNKLIHDYDRVSVEKVYAYLQDAPKIFVQFFDYFNIFLEKQQRS